MGLYVCFFVVVLMLYHGSFINGGITSSFVRKEEKSIDMPFHSDVFSHPPGYNAPQQVFFLACSDSIPKTIYLKVSEMIHVKSLTKPTFSWIKDDFYLWPIKSICPLYYLCQMVQSNSTKIYHCTLE